MSTLPCSPCCPFEGLGPECTEGLGPECAEGLGYECTEGLAYECTEVLGYECTEGLGYEYTVIQLRTSNQLRTRQHVSISLECLRMFQSSIHVNHKVISAQWFE